MTPVFATAVGGVAAGFRVVADCNGPGEAYLCDTLRPPMMPGRDTVQRGTRFR